MVADETEPEEGQVEETSISTVLDSLTRGEIDAQVRTAKAYPRSIKTFIGEALSMATLDEETAASCIYALPRGGKPIEGPSARLAEIIASAWGNCRYGARTVSEEDRFVTAQGYFFDVQRNSAVAFEVRRRITDKYGKRYNDDMVGVTANAACSIALRNAVFKGVPKAFWGRVYEAARKTAIGDAKTIEAKRAEMIGYFGKMGVAADRIIAAVGKTAVEDIGINELAVLKGVATAIREGETTIEQAFPPAAPPTVRVAGAVKVDDVLTGKTKTETPSRRPSTADPVAKNTTTASPSVTAPLIAKANALVDTLGRAGQAIYSSVCGERTMDELSAVDLTRLIEALEGARQSKPAPEQGELV